MKIYFCPNPIGFHAAGISEIPPGSIEIGEDEYTQLIDGQSAGNILSVKDGHPVLTAPPPLPAIQQAEKTLATSMSTANQQIAIIEPAVDGGYAKQEHTMRLADWQRYRYELTLVPEQPGWPDSPQWPTEPDKII